MRRPPHHFAVHNHADPKLDVDIAFWTEAARIQLERDIAPAWDGWAPPPGMAFYSYSSIPPKDAAVVTFVPDAFRPDAAAFHTALGSLVALIVDLSRSPIPSRSLTHETAEAWRDPFLDQWIPDPVRPSREIIMEIGDPVQTSSYEIEVEMLRTRRKVKVSNFVLPEWFDLPGKAGAKRYDHLGVCRDVRHIPAGGYLPASEQGEVVLLGPREAGASIAFSAAKMSPLSRTHQILLRGRPVS